MHPLVELGVTVAPHERAPPLFVSEGLWLAQQGHPTLPQPPDHSFQRPVIVVCGRGKQGEGGPSQPQPSTSAPAPSTAPVGRPKAVCGLPCMGLAAGGVSPRHGLPAWAGLGCGQGGRRGRCQSELYALLLTPTSPLLTEAERDPASSSGSSASVSL